MKKKKKFAPRFAIARRGYDIDSVEAYIALEREKADRAGLEQKERIRLLKAQCERLTAELGVYRDKEEQIKSALITAGEQAEKSCWTPGCAMRWSWSGSNSSAPSGRARTRS